MEFFKMIEAKWQEFCKKTQPARKYCADILKEIGWAIKLIWKYVYKLRAVLLAVPVIIGAVILAFINMSKLPESVGINLLADGTFSVMVSRWIAVLIPLGLTGFCVVLTLGARKTLYPWLISLFTLALPLLIYVTNVYPA